jgi:CheY-like chemotaxis protein
MQPRKQVLVVDDDVVILRLIRESLTALLNLQVETTPNPGYAFELMLKKHYDLLIFDFAMPEINGDLLYSLISKVYSTSTAASRPRPPLLVVSGYAYKKRVQDLLRQPGSRGLLAKPFTIEHLLDKVECALGC